MRLPLCLPLVLVLASPALTAEPARPNIILMMADDLGWGDTGYNGHPVIKTPNLDAMSKTGLRFNRFYAAAPVCSPTRGSCLTGRHPYRYGIVSANRGHMLPKERTLAEILKGQGYATGHFGKWHLGTLTTTKKDSNRGGPKGAKHFSPPWKNGFDVCFSTEAKVPTYDPMVHPKTGKPYGTAYWNDKGDEVTEILKGDDSRIIMDRVLPFLDDVTRSKKPFFAIVWFHAPHLPVVAGPRHRKLYADQPEGLQHYYGCISALDDQVGRLRQHLRKLGVADDTLLTFCSDNGPEGRTGPGSAGPFRGRKRDLYEGGVRVAGLMEWPRRFSTPRTIETPCCTSDYVPTILSLLNLQSNGQPSPIDGIDLMPILEGKVRERGKPIGFQSANVVALSDDQYKLFRKGKGAYQLYDLLADPSEKKDIAAAHPEIVERMTKTLEEWQRSCEASADGKDYR